MKPLSFQWIRMEWYKRKTPLLSLGLTHEKYLLIYKIQIKKIQKQVFIFDLDIFISRAGKNLR